MYNSNIYCYCSKNVDYIFTYNHIMALISLPSRSRVKSIHGFNEIRSFMYTQLYNITSKYYFKTICNGPDET